MPQITGLLIPAGLILVINLVVFVLAIWNINRTRMGNSTQHSRHRERIRRIINACIVLTLLGLAWVFGFLVNLQSREAGAAFEVLFILLNSFQGFTIFLIYCLKPEAARKQLKDNLCCPNISLPGQSSRATRSSTPPVSPAADQNENNAKKSQAGENPHQLSPRNKDNGNHYVSS